MRLGTKVAPSSRVRARWLRSASASASACTVLLLTGACSHHPQNAPTNEGFAGIYDFKQWRKYPGYLPKFADCLREPNGILVVHPGLEENWRRQEFESLRDFAALDGRINRFQH